jgi:endonuclease/exonuclease/phosphatase family metal-dependent hydrolase
MEMYAQIPISHDDTIVSQQHGISGTPTYHNDIGAWVPHVPPPTTRTSFTLATYNVLHDASFPLKNRLVALKNAILDSHADVICLQEVTDEFLSSLLGNSQIQEQFRWCSRSDRAVMESERNVILLAREDYGFEWIRIELGGKHKAAVVAWLHTPHAVVVIAGVHLSKGRAAPALQKKREELSALVAYLHLHHAADEWIIVGDTNWPDSEPLPLEDELTDVWTSPGVSTYDPTTNSLAAATALESWEPQRYDRILIKRSGSLSVPPESLELFGLPPVGTGPPSDHWGLKATVQVGAASTAPTAPATDGIPITLLSTSLADAELRDFCAQHDCFPSIAQDHALKCAVETLRAFVLDVSSPAPAIDSLNISSVVRFVVAPVGSFAMGYHNPGSDVDCIVVGNINPGTFWSLMRWKIRAAVGGTGDVQLRRFVKDASVQMMELAVHGVKMDLQYCPAGKLIEW